MARILFSWELGGGMGHIVPYLGIIEALLKDGHQLYFVMRDLSLADQVFAGHSVTYFQAPYHPGTVANPVEVSHSYAHILHNVGFSEPSGLTGRLKGWRALFELIKPNLIVFNHSPTALLAAKSFPAKRMLIGTGFTIPPKQYPFPNFRRWSPITEEQLKRDEDRMLDSVNFALKQLGTSPLIRLADLFDVDCGAIDSYTELDHYPACHNRNYRGPCFSEVGEIPVWPGTHGKKIFVYVKPSIANPALFAALKESGHRAIIFGNHIPEQLQRRFSSDSIRFVSQPQNIQLVAKQADIAILNAGHNTIAAMLLAAKPVLMLPLTIEQYLTTKNVERLGAGISCSIDKPSQIAAALTKLVECPSYAIAANSFSQKYDNEHVHGRGSLLFKKIVDLLQ